jgi:hypothetical protein
LKPWEIIEENLTKAGWSLGSVSAVEYEGRTIWIADAHRGDGKGYVVQPDEKLTACFELQATIRARRIALTGSPLLFKTRRC